MKVYSNSGLFYCDVSAPQEKGRNCNGYYVYSSKSWTGKHLAQIIDVNGEVVYESASHRSTLFKNWDDFSSLLEKMIEAGYVTAY